MKEEEEGKKSPWSIKATNCIWENLVGWNWLEGGLGGKVVASSSSSSHLPETVFQGVQCQWVLAEAMEQKQKPGLLPGWLFLLLCQFSFSPDDWTYIQQSTLPANCVKQIKLIKCILPIDFELIVRVCVCVECLVHTWVMAFLCPVRIRRGKKKKGNKLVQFFPDVPGWKKKVFSRRTRYL